MKKAEIKIGKHYIVEVSGRLIVVRLVAENRYGGWDASNITMGQDIWVTTAASLRREATSDEVVIKQVLPMERAFFIENPKQIG